MRSAWLHSEPVSRSSSSQAASPGPHLHAHRPPVPRVPWRSRCLGLRMMIYGDPATQPWAQDEDSAEPIVRQAVEAGVTLFDTVGIYCGGVSEQVTGRPGRPSRWPGGNGGVRG